MSNRKPPFYIFDKGLFKSQITKYQEYAFVYYPIKANDHPLVIQSAFKLGCSFEVDSIEHIKFLTDEMGIDGNNLLFSFPVREDNDIIAALGCGVSKFVIDTADEYVRISKKSETASFFVRVVIDNFIKDCPSLCEDKWGASVSTAKELLDFIQEKRPNHLLGISFYIPQNVNTRYPFSMILRHITNEFQGYSIPLVNIGGGISTTTLASLRDEFSNMRSRLGTEGIIVEPGRHLLDPCIDMYVEVINVRVINDHRLVIINASIYSGLLDAKLKRKIFPIEDPNTDTQKSFAFVCGNSSDNDDVIGEYYLRDSLMAGDRLIIHECGAYSAVMQTRFYMKSDIEMYIKEST